LWVTDIITEMEISIIQHAKDTKPRTVSVGDVAEMIRNGSWPRDYPPTILVQGVFEEGVRQQDITRMSGLAMTEFRITDPVPDGVGDFRHTARDDPHTLLMFASDDCLTVIYAYEVDKSYDLESQRKFYQRVLVYGNDYYESLLGMPPVRKGHKVGKQCTLCHDPDVYYNPEA
jgi:VirE N-terminal domain.